MEMMAIPGKRCQEGKVAEFVVDRLRRAGAPAGGIEFDSAHRRTPELGECARVPRQLERVPGAHCDHDQLPEHDRHVRVAALFQFFDELAEPFAFFFKTNCIC